MRENTVDNNRNSYKRHRYVIVNPVRFFIFVLVSTLIIAFAGYSLLSIGNAEAAQADTYAQVVIQEDDTLWDIATAYNPEYRGDVRNLICDIYEINDIGADDIHPGDIVFVPIY